MTAPKLLESGLVSMEPRSVTLTDKPAVPQPHGGSLNQGGKLGNPGGKRHPEWLKHFCDNKLAHKRSRRSVARILANPDHPAFATMWKAAADRAHGKPKESKEISGTLDIRVVRDA